MGSQGGSAGVISIVCRGSTENPRKARLVRPPSEASAPETRAEFTSLAKLEVASAGRFFEWLDVLDF